MSVVVTTLSAGTLPGLTERLEWCAVHLREAPLLTFDAPLDWSPLDAALERLQDFSAVVLTSPRAARAVQTRLNAAGSTRPLLLDPNREVWVTGKATANALNGALEPIHLPHAGHGGTATSALIAAEMLQHGVCSTVLYPSGDRHREELPGILGTHGVTVHETPAYRTRLASPDAARKACEGADIVLVGSPRVARLLALVTAPSGRPALVTIGPVSARSAAAHGWEPAAIATAATAEGVSRAIHTLSLTLGSKVLR